MIVHSGQWSKLKKRILSFVTATVRRRIDVHAAGYRHAHDGLGRVWVTVDGEEIFSMDTLKQSQAEWKLRNELTDMNKLTPRDAQADALDILHRKGIFDQFDAYNAFDCYGSLPFDEALASSNVIIQGFAMLDRRLGKRRLRSLDLSNSHNFVVQMYRLRCECEGIRLNELGDDVHAG